MWYRKRIVLARVFVVINLPIYKGRKYSDQVIKAAKSILHII
jgi:hypothetical protein